MLYLCAGSPSVDTEPFLDGDLAPVDLDNATEAIDPESVVSWIGATYDLSVTGTATTGVYRVTAADGFPAVDRLTFTVTGEVDSVPVSQQVTVDIVGARIVTPTVAATEGRQSGATAADVARVLDRFLDLYQTARGTSPVPRIAKETFTAATLPCAYRMVLRWPLVLDVVSVTVDGVAVSTVLSGNVLTRTDGGLFTPLSPSGTVEVVYTYGWDSPSPSARAAAVAFVRAEINNLFGDSIGRTYESVNSAGYAFRPGTPDVNADRWSGYIDVDGNLALDPDYRVPSIA